MTIDELSTLPCGAKFFRADLHIHSLGASHDVSDQLMTPEAIVATAIAENLTLISVTDHNEIRNVERTIIAARGSDLFVVPGIELSTSDGHLLCYLPSVEALTQLHGRLSFADPGTQTSRCQTSILECLRIIDNLKGFCILAHVDSPKGFEFEVPGNSPHKADVICHAALLGIELKSAASGVSYGISDLDPGRKSLGAERRVRLKLGSRQFLARVMNSDSHNLNALGRNAQGDKRVTRYKMHRPSFEGLRIALQDADARVRIEDQIPFAIPHIAGIHMEGGFLAGQSIHFSPNLNCIIGSRGAGKSTTFEAVRCLSSEAGDAYMLDSEVWPTQIDLFWRDASGQVQTLLRMTGGVVENQDSSFMSPTSFPIDCFGQGDAAKISQTAKDNPQALLRYLDRFIDLRATLAIEEKLQADLLESQTAIEKASQQVALTPAWEQALATARNQLRALEQANATDVISLQRKLADEIETRNQLRAKLKSIKEAVLSPAVNEEIGRLRSLGDPNGHTPVCAEMIAIMDLAGTFAGQMEGSKIDAQRKFEAFHESTNEKLAGWKARDGIAAQEIEEKRKLLESQGVRLDMSFIQKLAKDEAAAAQNVKALEGWQVTKTRLLAERVELMKLRWEARARVSALRVGFGIYASRTLRAALSDITVSLKYVPDAYSPTAEQLIIQAMGWRTVQVARARLLVEVLTVPKLLAAIKANDKRAVTSLETAGGVKPFDSEDATLLFQKLGEPSMRSALERVTIDDLPKLTVTRMITVPGGQPRALTRSFSALSLGQQQSVLLSLMLSSESTDPLLIDQPEDNLDSEFIYSSLIPVLRRAKERRQVIIVTHNANIAVLSDAEQIAVLKATSEQASIVSRGSIDDPVTRKAACAILEGSEEAFLLRSQIYGL